MVHGCSITWLGGQEAFPEWILGAVDRFYYGATPWPARRRIMRGSRKEPHLRYTASTHAAAVHAAVLYQVQQVEGHELSVQATTRPAARSSTARWASWRRCCGPLWLQVSCLLARSNSPPGCSCPVSAKGQLCVECLVLRSAPHPAHALQVPPFADRPSSGRLDWAGRVAAVAAAPAEGAVAGSPGPGEAGASPVASPQRKKARQEGGGA